MSGIPSSLVGSGPYDDPLAGFVRKIEVALDEAGIVVESLAELDSLEGAFMFVISRARSRLFDQFSPPASE